MSAGVLHQWVCIECGASGFLTDDLSVATGARDAHNENVHTIPEEGEDG